MPCCGCCASPDGHILGAGRAGSPQAAGHRSCLDRRVRLERISEKKRLVVMMAVFVSFDPPRPARKRGGRGASSPHANAYPNFRANAEAKVENVSTEQNVFIYFTS